MLIIFGPVLALGAVTALIAAVSEAAGWYPDVMGPIAYCVGGAVMLMAIVLFFVQTRLRRAADRALHDVEARMGRIVESAMDAVITIDERERIVQFNAAAETIFGCPRDEAIGAPLSWFIPERFRGAHARHIHQFGRESVSSRRMAGQRIIMGLRRSGEEFPLDASISWISEGGQKYFTVILRDVTARVRRDEELRRSREELREFAAAASTVREQEKSRIARELHDELGQALTALGMDLQWMKERMPAGQGPMASKLEAMRQTLDSTVAATRRISADLRPLMLDDLGLVPATEWLVRNFTQRHGIHCELSVDPPELELRDPHATAVFRILQESLTNVARHSHASLVQVSLDASDGEIVLRVRDNGRGFDPAGPRKPASFGLVGLRERAFLLDGAISIDAAPGRGTVVEVRIPLQPAPAS